MANRSAKFGREPDFPPPRGPYPPPGMPGMYTQSVYGGQMDMMGMRRPTNILPPAPPVVTQDPSGMVHSPWAQLNKGEPPSPRQRWEIVNVFFVPFTCEFPRLVPHT